MKFIYIIYSLISISLNAEAKSNPSQGWNLNSMEKSTPASSSIKPIKKSDQYLGFRAGQFGAFEGATSLGASYEYLYSSDFGFAGQFHYVSYKKELTLGDFKAELGNKAYTVVALGNWHPHFIRSRSLDPFVSIGLAHSFVSSQGKITSSPATPSEFGMPAAPIPVVEAEGDETFLVGSLNLRYFLDNRLSALGSVGIGLSSLMIGVDYQF